MIDVDEAGIQLVFCRTIIYYVMSCIYTQLQKCVLLIVIMSRKYNYIVGPNSLDFKFDLIGILSENY